MRRRVLWLLALALVVAGLGDGGLWLLGVRRLQADAAGQTAALRAAGWQVETGAPQPGGWPLEARVDFPMLRLVHPSGTAWQSAGLRLTIALLRPLRLGFSLVGPHVLTPVGLLELPMTAARLDGWFGLTVPGTGEIAARDLRLDLPGGAVHLDSFDLRASPEAGGAWTAEAEVDGITLDGQTAAPWLGNRIDRIAVQVALSGALPGGFDRAAAARWRQEGGTIQVRQFALAWGQLDLEADARLDLDAALQPEGDGTLRATGVVETLDTLSKQGLIAPGPARAIGTVLLLLPRTPDGQVVLPIGLHDRRLSVARFPLTGVPEWRWPDGK
jgi:hypothetical protein